MSTKEELRQRVLGKPTIVEVDVEGEKYHARLPAGDVWQDILDRLAETEKANGEAGAAGMNRRWYEMLTLALAHVLCDPESKALLFDPASVEDLKALGGAQGGKVPKLWTAIMKAIKEHATALGKESGPTESSNSG